MRSNTARAVAGLVVVALAIVLFIVFQGGDDEVGTPLPQGTAQQPGDPQDGEVGPAETTPPFEPVKYTVRVRDGALVGEVAEIDVTTGETVAFQVVSDEPADIHVHGYEIEKTLEPNKPVLISFGADIEGSFEAEIHGETFEFPIAEINVSPG